MRIVSKTEIEGVISPRQLMNAVEASFIAFSSGEVRTPPVGYLPFTDPPGDMHIKYGHMVGDDIFVVKLATGFYENPQIGLPSSNGFLMVLSAKTGMPLALLQDEGLLTDCRTAAAGAIASRALMRSTANSLGVIGTGIQARLQILYHHTALNLKRYYIWGRDTEKMNAVVRDMKSRNIDVVPVQSVQGLCASSDILVTTTPSEEPILHADDVQDGTHITAIGADAPDKQELDPEIFKKAGFICFDSQDQCLHHGESSHAKVDFSQGNSAELGAFLKCPDLYTRTPDDITIVDLTGIAAQDIAAAKLVWNAVNGT